MKKILIISHAMELGGAERSLLGLLDSINYDQYEVDLFLLRQEGELLSLIPEQVHMLPEIPAYTVLARPMEQTFREGHVILTAARMVGKIKADNYAKKHHHTESAVAIEYSHKYTKRFMPGIQSDIEYDLAISFLTPHYFVAEKVRAKKKIAWIHTDYTKIGINQPSELKMWERMDHIISISDAVTESFLKVFPTLKEKMVLIENILPQKLVRYQAEALDVTQEIPENDGVKLLTIGRFSSPKKIEEIPEICSRICESCLNVKWYLIGYGGMEDIIKENITRFHMEDHVIILGKRDNPYPYIKACDIYVQPSRYEGKCVAVREAQMLGKPVIITNYPTASSQLEDGVDGIIVPMEVLACADGIVEVIKNRDLQEMLRENCNKRDYSNAEEVNKLYELLKKH